MAKPSPLRIHPQEGDLAALEQYVLAMPGGKKLTGWQDEPKELVAVWVRATRPRYPLPLIFDAYPPREAFEGDASGGYLFEVPELIAEMLAWYAEEYEWHADPVPSQEGETLEETAGILQRIWAIAQEDSIEEVLEIHQHIRRVAQDEGLDAKVLRDVALTLWKDSAANGCDRYDESVEKAAAVLAK